MIASWVSPDCDPVLRSFISLIANLKTVVPLLGSHVTTVNRIHQQGFQIGFIPYIFPIFRVFLFPILCNRFGVPVSGATMTGRESAVVPVLWI